MQFHKFALKGESWLKAGNYLITDEKDALAYRVKSNIWQIRKEFFLLSEHNDIIYRIKSNSSLNNHFTLFEQDVPIASIEKPFSWSTQVMEITTKVTDPFVVRGNIWGNEYQFDRDGEDFAMVSYNIWSSGQLGVAIKIGEIVPLILSVVVIIAYLKQSGMA